MTLTNAIRKLERHGWKAEGEPGKPFWKYVKANQVIDLGCNPPHEDGTRTVVMIDQRTRGMTDDLQSDYHAGMFCDSLSQAMRLAGV